MTEQGRAPALDAEARLRALSPAKRALLEARRARTGREGSVRIGHRPDDEPAVLSSAQERTWLLEQLGSAGSYNAPRAQRVHGPLDVDAVRAALDAIVARHEALRTAIKVVDGEPTPVVAESFKVPCPLVDLSGQPSDEALRRAHAIVDEEVNRPFDLSEGMLLRGVIVRLATDDHVLVLVSHHIASDERSKRILGAELAEIYESLVTGRRPQLPELPIQYADYAYWQRHQAEQSATADLEYWRATLDGAAQLALPTVHPRPARPSFRGATLQTRLPAELSAALTKLGREYHATTFMTLLSAFATVLSRYTGQEDIVVGTPVSGRNYTELEHLIGFFSNTVVLRTNLSDGPGFGPVIDRVRDTVVNALGHQSLPFERVVEELRPQRDLTRNPLFQVMFTLRPGSTSAADLAGLETERFGFHSESTKFDLSLITIEEPDGILLVWEYSLDLFDREWVERLGAAFNRLVQEAVADPDRPVRTLPLGDADADHGALVGEVRVVGDGSLVSSVVERAGLCPSAVAVRCGSGVLSYAELDAGSSRLGRALVARGVSAGSLVGVCLSRRVELPLVLLAVLKAGGAYVPVDPSWPAARLGEVLESAGVDLVVSDAGSVSVLGSAGGYDGPVLDIDSDWGGAGFDGGPLDTGVRGSDLAYVIFTSGSTGRPKGVMIEHRSVLNLLDYMCRWPGLEAGQTMVGVTTPAFDLSVPDLWMPLVVGATLVLASREEASDPGALAALLDEVDADLMQATPATWRMLCEWGWAGRPGMRVVCGGEGYGAALVSDLCARVAEVWNFYGPTEATVWTVCTRLDAGTVDPVPMGGPMWNTSCYVLDEQLNPVPTGLPGELYLAGAGLARGYLGRPDLTEERFVACPFGEGSDARMYRTGDVVRANPDGTLTYLGRSDHQVKVRGFRIELGEIEAVLERHDAVSQAVVTLRGGPEEARLVGYAVTHPAGTVDARELRQWVAEQLPTHMVPAAIVTLDQLPLTPNGKVDRDKLPDPQPPQRQQPAVPPSDDTQRRLLRMWQEVLGIPDIGVTDDFFELGVDSLVAARLFAHIEKEFGARLPVAAIYRARTVAELAQMLRDETETGAGSKWTALVPLRETGFAPPFFAVHGGAGSVMFYRPLVERMDPDQPFYAFQAVGLYGREVPQRSVGDMAARYIEEMRAVQPSGPYAIGGYCYGGLVAYEMAVQLAQQGQEISLVAMFNAPSPTYNRRYNPIFDGEGALTDEDGVPLDRYRTRMTAPSLATSARRHLAPGLKPGQRLQLARNELGRVRWLARRRIRRGQVDWAIRRGHPLPENLREGGTFQRLAREAQDAYEPPVTSLPIVVYRAAGLYYRADLGWGDYSSAPVDTLEVQGEQRIPRDTMEDAPVAAVAVHLAAALARTGHTAGRAEV